MDLRTGVCPLCRSAAVHLIDGATLTGNNRIPVSAFGSASLSRYICVTCGYTQEFMEFPEDRDKVARKWPRVDPGHGPPRQ
ncbi:MAG TPA: hypothetical protein VD886_26215 [Herpetosiphonaceae bacterium]|nr:hypothetical protein [Herpetosiphonaceae bacterium]